MKCLQVLYLEKVIKSQKENMKNVRAKLVSLLLKIETFEFWKKKFIKETQNNYRKLMLNTDRKTMVHDHLVSPIPVQRCWVELLGEREMNDELSFSFPIWKGFMFRILTINFSRRCLFFII